MEECAFYYGYFILSMKRLMSEALQHIACKHGYHLKHNYTRFPSLSLLHVLLTSIKHIHHSPYNALWYLIHMHFCLLLKDSKHFWVKASKQANGQTNKQTHKFPIFLCIIYFPGHTIKPSTQSCLKMYFELIKKEKRDWKDGSMAKHACWVRWLTNCL